MSLRSKMMSVKRKLKQGKLKKLYFAIGPLFGAYRNARIVCARLFRGYDDNMVVFSSFYLRTYSDSPRYISELLHEKRPETKIVWLFDEPEKARKAFDIPAYVTVCNSIGRKGVSALARARVVVDNASKRFYLKFPGKGQTYVQTWHGDRPFKKIGYDHEGFHNIMIEENASLLTVGSDFGEKILRKAFRYNGPVQKLGTPRNDVLVRNDPAQCAAIRQRLNLDADTRVLVYAPTYRDTDFRAGKKQAVPLDLPHVLDTLERTTGEKWKCLVRAHYFAYGISMEDTSDRLIPASAYPEMTDLLLIADALLTDYSSCASDFVILRRPIYLYQDDIDQYQSQNRELYLPMSDYDYWVAHTPEELDRLIEQTTPERAAENCDKIMEFYGMAETGRATEAVVDYILSKLPPAKK